VPALPQPPLAASCVPYLRHLWRPWGHQTPDRRADGDTHRLGV